MLLQSLRLFPPLLWLTISLRTSPYPQLPLKRIKRTVLSLLLLPFRQRSRHPPLLWGLPHPHREIFREFVHVFLLLPLVLVTVRRHCLIVPPVIKFHVVQICNFVLSQSLADRASLFVILFFLNKSLICVIP